LRGVDYDRLKRPAEKVVIAYFQVVTPGETEKYHKIFRQGQFLAIISIRHFTTRHH
jgi:hypothetical protein